MPELLKIQDQKAGSVGLMKDLELPDGASPLKEILDVLIPTQEMSRYQRDLRFNTRTQAVGIGQQAVFTWDVPADEYWKLVLMWIAHDTLGAGGVVFEFRRRLKNRLPLLFFTLWEGEIDDTADGEVIYPTAVQRARVTTNRFVDLRGNPDIEFWPQDELTVIQNNVAVTAGTVRICSLYEVLPRPRSIEIGVQMTGVAV